MSASRPDTEVASVSSSGPCRCALIVRRGFEAQYLIQRRLILGPGKTERAKATEIPVAVSGAESGPRDLRVCYGDQRSEGPASPFTTLTPQEHRVAVLEPCGDGRTKKMTPIAVDLVEAQTFIPASDARAALGSA